MNPNVSPPDPQKNLSFDRLLKEKLNAAASPTRSVLGTTPVSAPSQGGAASSTFADFLKNKLQSTIPATQSGPAAQVSTPLPATAATSNFDSVLKKKQKQKLQGVASRTQSAPAVPPVPQLTKTAIPPPRLVPPRVFGPLKKTALAATICAVAVGIVAAFLYLQHQRTLASTERAYAQGNSAFQNGDFEQAVANYSSGIRLTPDYKPAYVKRGMANLALLKYAQSLADYDTAIRLDSNYSDAYFARGTLHWLLGELDESESDYRKAVELEPNDKAYYDRWATVLYEQKKDALVVEVYEHAYEGDREREWALWGWLSALYTVDNADNPQRLAGACGDLEGAGVHSAALSYHAGIVSISRKNYGDALQKLEEAERTDPENTPAFAYNLLYSASKHLGDTSRTERYRQEVKERTGQDPENNGTQGSTPN
jgi:tetratricopeptide (TPR) repeat protein